MHVVDISKVTCPASPGPPRACSPPRRPAAWPGYSSGNHNNIIIIIILIIIIIITIMITMIILMIIII